MSWLSVKCCMQTIELYCLKRSKKETKKSGRSRRVCIYIFLLLLVVLLLFLLLLAHFVLWAKAVI